MSQRPQALPQSLGQGWIALMGLEAPFLLLGTNQEVHIPQEESKI